MSNTNKTAELFKQTVAKIPEGYYAGDRANPNLRTFVEQHLKQAHPSPAEDKYDVTAFDKSIETSKATAIYNMHSYWAKKPHDAIRQYISHYTRPADLVLDPFCGSGGTALAALMEGRKVIASDCSPAATFITKNYCTPVNTQEVLETYQEIKRDIEPLFNPMYATVDKFGNRAQIGYTTWSETYRCPKCLNIIPLAELSSSDDAKSAVQSRERCHRCNEHVPKRPEFLGMIPVRITYRSTVEKRGNRDLFTHANKGFQADSDQAKKYFPSKPLPRNFIDASFPPGTITRQPISSGHLTISSIFTGRNLSCIVAIRDRILKTPSPSVRDFLLFCLEGVVLTASKMYKEESRNIQSGTYYCPPIMREVYPFNLLDYKVQQAIQGSVEAHADIKDYNFCISTQDVRTMDIPTESIDYIFTDPPYSGKVQFAEANFVWEKFLGFDTSYWRDEIIISEPRSLDQNKWRGSMLAAFKECFRVLKAGRYLSLCYHDSASGTWQMLQDVMAETGFVNADGGDQALYIEVSQKSHKQRTADNVQKRDLVINFQKPRPGHMRKAVNFTGHEDTRTFREKAQSVLRQFLKANPGAVKDRIQDEVVSHLVRKGQMEAHDFDELLRQVADESRQPVKKSLFENEDPDLLGSHEVSRWYLKETEVGGEEAEQASADAAGAKIQEFLVQSTARKLKDTEAPLNEMQAELARKRQLLQAIDQGKSTEARPRLVREVREVSEKLERLEAERFEWRLQALHYSEILEYSFCIQPKPRSTLEDLLEDYCYQTDEGNWRPPTTEAEKAEKCNERQRAVRRKIQRFFTLVETGDAIPENHRPDTHTVAEWIRHCRRTGLHAQGKLLYERGGLSLDQLNEEDQVTVEEDYQVCVRALSRSGSGPNPVRQISEI